MPRILGHYHRKRRLVYLLASSTIITVLYLQNWAHTIRNNEQEIEIFLKPVVLSKRRISSVSKYNLKWNDTNYERTRMLLDTSGVYKQAKAGKLGFINVHLWFELCGTSLLTLKRFPCFPNTPSSRKQVPSLDLKNLGQNYGKRVFGFIILPHDARSLTFRLQASGSAEFWFSVDENPANSKCLAFKNEKSTEVVSHEVKLYQAKLCYFEILHKHGVSKHDYLKLEWKFDNSYNFEAIPANNLKSYQDDCHIFGGVVNVLSFPPVGLKMHSKIGTLNTKYSSMPKDTIYKLPFIPEVIIENIFPECKYKPDYLVTRTIHRYAAEWEMIYSSIYPPDRFDTTASSGYQRFGNDLLEKETAFNIVDKVLSQFQKKGVRHFTLEKILNIEEKQRRYLVELQLQDIHTKKSVRFSEYLYLQKGSDELCYPQGFKWNKSAMVNFIITTGGKQGKWIYHFIQNMEKIYKETNDNNFNVIINDFQSQDIDIKQVLEHSSLPNYLYLSNARHFHKTLGLQTAADTIKDPNGIVAILDLHLDVPSYYLDDLRKHTIRGFQAYSPILERMECGTNLAVYMGSIWESRGYGLVGVYKQDWDTFGGMNVKEFTNKWGGEDVEMMDRIVMAGFEADRKKLRGLVHYYHSRSGMWQTASKGEQNTTCIQSTR